jgi:uncharacterized membrane protein HdeD (DUF308 family)
MIQLTETFCKRWISFLLSGFLLAILGTIALSSMFWTTMATVLFFGAMLVAASVIHILHAFWAIDWKGFFTQLIVGILSGIIGWVLLSNPGVGAATITLLIAVLFISAGLFKIAGSLLLDIEEWGWLLASGIVSLALGLLILARWPSSALWVVGLFIGIDLLASGISSIAYSLRLRKACKLKEHTQVIKVELI